MCYPQITPMQSSLSLSPTFCPKYSQHPWDSSAWASDYMAQVSLFEQEISIHLCQTTEIWEFISIACIGQLLHEASHFRTD